jgi:putative transposase
VCVVHCLVMLYTHYPSDLSDSEWAIIGQLVPQPKTNGRYATLSRRALLNAMFYVTKTGCGWEWLPREFPKWKTVYHYFRLWRLSGLWHTIHTILRQMLRQALGRNVEPSAAIIDSQSVKTTYVGGPERGFDGGKKINGRKRHLVVDTQGLVVTLKVHAANISDRDGAQLVLDDMPKRFPRIRKLWTDSGYNGRFRTWAAEHLAKWDVEIVKHWWTGIKGVWVGPDQEPPTIPSGFHVLPKRWIVERTFAWLDQNRRLSKDYERLPMTSETFMYVAMIRLMLRRLARRASQA